jgi:hypothetical protein
MRARKRQEEAYWQPISYIATKKPILLRCLSEKGCVPDTEGQANLAKLPNTFNEFITTEKADE